MTQLLTDASGRGPAEEAFGSIASQGVVGAFCALLIVALVFTMRALLSEKDARFADQKAMAEAMKTLNDAARDLTIEMHRSASNLTLEMARHLESVKLALDRYERAVAQMVHVFEDMQKEQVRLVSAIASRSHDPGLPGE